MAARGGSRSGKRPTPSARASSGGTPAKRKGSSPRASDRQPSPRQTPSTPPTPAGPFRLGAVAGTTPGKWIDIWHSRMPHTPLELVPLQGASQRDAVLSASVDAALVRLPVDRDGLHAIALYEEVPVVVCGAESHLTAADELTLGDLAGEVVITPRDAVLEVDVPGGLTPRFDAPATTEEAIATVAAGVGVVIVPMSLARLHHRKDVEHRPLADGPGSTVALVWRDPTEDEAAVLVETFIGIVRGRTANSSRS